MNSKRIDVRHADPGEFAAVDALLEASGARPLPPGIYASNVMVALEGRVVVGAVAFEVVGRTGVALWAAVAADHAGEPVLASLVRGLVARVQELGLREIYASQLVASARLADFAFTPATPGALPSAVRLRPWYPKSADREEPLQYLDLESRF